MKKVQCLLLILFVFVASGFADENTSSKVEKGTSAIMGRIVDENSLPLPGAAVVIAGTTTGAVSNVDGFYRLLSVDGEKVTIEVHYIGFEVYKKEVVLEKGKTLRIDMVLSSGLALDEIKVQGNLQGQVKALNQQKNSDRVMNVVSSDQTSRFPDENIGDALKRIPGVSIQTDMGEARFGHIRGTSPEYNSVTINGDRMPSAEAENRSNQLDLIPADMIQTIEVSKVVTADMEGDAIGGAVNLVTKSSPYKRRISGSIVSGYNFGSEKAPASASILYGDRFANSAIGIVLSASYQNNHTRADDVEAEWEEGENFDYYTSDYQVRQYNVQRERQSYSAALDFNLSQDHILEVKGLYNRRKDWENRYRLRYKDVEETDEGALQAGSVRRQTKGGVSDNKDARLEDQKNMNVSLGGEHHFGKVKLEWKGSYAKASEERPNERYVSYQNKDQDLNVDFTDVNRPFLTTSSSDELLLGSNWGLKELTEEFQYTEDEDKNLRVDVEIPLLSGDFGSKLKFGGRMKWKNKERNNSFYEYEPTDEGVFDSNNLSNLSNQSSADFMVDEKYQIGNFVSTDQISTYDLTNTSNFEGEAVAEEMAVNFTASEQINAGYIRYDQQISKLKAIFGLRLEQTNLDYQGYEYDMDEDELKLSSSQESDYVNWMPSLILKYEATDRFQLKGAYTNTISRPKYWSLVPYKNISVEDNEIQIGNPGLEPTTSINFDLMSEYYFGASDAFTFGVFYKEISNFIVEQELRDYTYEGTTWDKFSQDVNGGNANLFGVEVSIQKQLDFLGDFFSNFNVYGNYTYNHSKVSDFNIEDRESEDLALPGTPEHTFNASLSYGTDKLNLRASFNYASDFIDELGSEAFYDAYYDKVTYLDLNGSYTLNKNWIVFAEVNNVLNQSLRYYQGSNDFIRQEEFYGMKAQFGVKANF